MDFDDIVNNDINLEIKQQLYKCFAVYGLEGTEEKIKSLYQLMPTIKELFLNEYYRILKGK